ncbi:MAG: glycosyltransferase family 2 protein [Deltaproteobacteria bacterium]|nr:glycosyltransferase family 2 protein [Deltaproteobacteria bacterium]
MVALNPSADEPPRRLPTHRVAVAIPCFNEAARIPALLDAVASLDPPPGLVFALDDGSHDATADLLSTVDGIELLRHERNLGLGAGRNTLWRTARQRGYPVVAFLDADVSPPPDFVRQVVDLFGSDLRLAGVGGRNIDELDATSSLSDSWRRRFWPQDMGPSALTDAPMLVGACAAYRTEALMDVGGFDAGFTTNAEDVDIGRRLRAADWRLRYEPGLVVRHRRRDDPRTLVHACFRHCREGMRATLKTPSEPPGPTELVLGMARKAARAPVASLVRRRSPAEAALGIVACGAGLAGYAAGWVRR